MPRNIVHLTVDSLRADHCGYCGSEHQLTPTLDSLARDGVAFEHGVAPGPRTPSSVPVSMTGEFPHTFNVEHDDWRGRRRRIASHMERHTTLPERLREAGYTTLGISANPWTANDTGFDAVFDEFYQVGIDDELIDQLETFPTVRALDATLDRLGRTDLFNWFNKRLWFIHWTDFYEELINRLEGIEDPFFCWVFLLTPHEPYVTPREFREENSGASMYYSIFRYFLRKEVQDMAHEPLPGHVERRLRRAYRDTVRSVDGFLERLIDDQRAGDPALVVHADHGEAFREHGTYGHQKSLYEENLWVPMVVYDGETTGRIQEPVSLRNLDDIVETVSREGEFDPRQFTSDVAVSMTEDGEGVSVTGTRWKLYQTHDRAELFDLSADPGEQEDVSESHPEVFKSMRTVLKKYCRGLWERRKIADAIEQIVV